MIPDADIQEQTTRLFVKKLHELGEDKFYQFLCSYASNSSPDDRKKQSPEIELMNYADRFLHLYRKENVDIYSTISFIFKRAAHKIYHILLKQSKTKKSRRFLNIIEGGKQA